MKWISSAIIPLFLLTILTFGFIKRVKVYECFVEGAKDGISTAARVFPYLLTMLVAIGIFRASGALDYLIKALAPVFGLIGVPKEVLPLALMRPLSGSGGLAILADILENFHPDSFIGRVASTMMGSSETIFYTLAVYFGSIGIKDYRHTLPAALMADFAAIVASVVICSWVFGP
ncbi:spore maturation protein [Irregularibacter muris]|uniref:spore maturation protein n=1 Tax=Irregularibacter muris TaxID=1796619 RepID=UPI002810D6F5|nr:spore maturation protein [Irregularibacter muris]